MVFWSGYVPCYLSLLMYRRHHGQVFFVESKLFEFIIHAGGKTLCVRIIEPGKGYLHLVQLGRGVFWLFSVVDEVAQLDNNRVCSQG